MVQTISPQQDTGWGVIYRLNNLFSEIELLAPTGKYDDWNIKLDRIWSNLLYRNSMEVKKDKNEKIISITLSDEDSKEKAFFDNKVSEAKRSMRIAKNLDKEENNVQREYTKAKNGLYDALVMKEIWLRKYMYKLGLYLKELKHNPAGAMWGK